MLDMFLQNIQRYEKKLTYLMIANKRKIAFGGNWKHTYSSSPFLSILTIPSEKKKDKIV